MQEILLLKCGELVLKGLNRSKFENRLVKTIVKRLKAFGNYDVRISQSVIYVEPLVDADIMSAFAVCEKVFGIVSISRCGRCNTGIDDICKGAELYLSDMLKTAKTFKVEARRTDKNYPLTSIQISQEVGGYLHDAFSPIVPQMNSPEITVRIEIRENGAYISGKTYSGAGGMPPGSAGRGLLMLSGGIDSPVAGYMMARRGLELVGIHFYSYPYTSKEAKEKVITLGEKMSVYAGKMPIFMVPFTPIQESIRTHCNDELFTIIMRRFMVRIADKLATIQECGCVITGESLGQVASQTLEAIMVTNEVANMPIYRPLIGMDKEEITKIARKIDTFETSILPFEDCCTVFTPKHPVTKPKSQKVIFEENKLDVDALVQEAFDATDYIVVGNI